MENQNTPVQNINPAPAPTPNPPNNLSTATTPAQQPVASSGKLTGNRVSIMVAALLMLAFVGPGFGLIVLPVILFFAIKGMKAGSKKGNDNQPRQPLNPAQIGFRVIGWLAISLIVAAIGFYTLIIIMFTVGGAKMG